MTDNTESRCECLSWVREYGVGARGEHHHRNCRHWHLSLGEAIITKKEIIVLGVPEEGDENHNCDAMGCSSVSHVVYRADLAASSQPDAVVAGELPPLPEREDWPYMNMVPYPVYTADQMRSYATLAASMAAGKETTPCFCPACVAGEDAPHEYHLEKRPKGKL